MGTSSRLSPENRARITKIQDALIDRYAEQKEALDRGQKSHAIALQFEIRELRREIEEIKDWATGLVGF
jgi:hypothetical protein